MSQKPRAVKVRIAVAVNNKGYWVASGWSGCSDDDARDEVARNIDHSSTIFWLTAELPITEPQTVEATVEKEG